MQERTTEFKIIQLKFVAPIIFQGVAKVLRSFLYKRDIQTPNN